MYNGFPSTTTYPSNDIYPLYSLFYTLIYDRTQADVEYRNTLHDKIADGTATTSEITEWSSDRLKGAYNYTDLNRVGSVLILVKSLTEEIGMTLTYPYSITTNYSRNNLPTGTDVSHLLANVQAVKTTYQSFITTVVPGSIKSIESANTIEYLLKEVGLVIDGTKAEYKYAGDIYSGGNY